MALLEIEGFPSGSSVRGHTSGGEAIMTEILLDGGLRVRTFKPAPEGFNPVEADARALAVYGYPSRPEDPRLLARWKEVLSRPIRLVEPEFKVRPRRRKDLPKPKISRKGQHPLETSGIWSGVVVHAPAGQSFKWIEGTWNLPHAYPPAGAVNGVWYSASSWIGIDGDGSGDVLQAGVDSDVMTSSGVVQHQLNPWWEWYPAGSFWITTLPVAYGDEINCLICVDADSTTAAVIFLYNVTQGIATHFFATAPAHVSLTGNCAEWIVERLEINTSAPELARYDNVLFTEANAATVSEALFDAGSGNVMDMTANGHVISEGVIESATQAEVKYTGP